MLHKNCLIMFWIADLPSNSSTLSPNKARAREEEENIYFMLRVGRLIEEWMWTASNKHEQVHDGVKWKIDGKNFWLISC